METTTNEPEKKSRPRKVFGKMRVETGGKPVTIQLTKKEIVVRPLHARRSYRMPVGRLVMHVMANAPLE
jgi:hypothetical protein